jgi:hypothetical protein
VARVWITERWHKWSLPTRISLVLGAAGILITAFAWAFPNAWNRATTSLMGNGSRITQKADGSRNSNIVAGGDVKIDSTAGDKSGPAASRQKGQGK